MALGGQHGSGAGIGRRCLGAAVGPGLQILQRVDDASAELSIGGTGAVGPVLFQRAAGEAEESRGFGRAQVSRRQCRRSDRASSGLRDLVERRRVRRRVWGHDGGADARRGMPKMRGWIFDTPRE